MTSTFAIKQFDGENDQSSSKKTRPPMRTITSFGNSLDQDDMIMERQEDEEQ